MSLLVNPHTPPEATLTVTLSSQETETEANKREDRLNRKKKKLNSSEIMETLREEFSTAPEVIASSYPVIHPSSV